MVVGLRFVLLQIADKDCFLNVRYNESVNTEEGFKANWENLKAENSRRREEFELKNKLKKKI